MSKKRAQPTRVGGEYRHYFVHDTMDNEQHIVSARSTYEAAAILLGWSVADELLVEDAAGGNDWFIIQELVLPSQGKCARIQGPSLSVER